MNLIREDGTYVNVPVRRFYPEAMKNALSDGLLRVLETFRAVSIPAVPYEGGKEQALGWNEHDLTFEKRWRRVPSTPDGSESM